VADLDFEANSDRELRKALDAFARLDTGARRVLKQDDQIDQESMACCASSSPT